MNRGRPVGTSAPGVGVAAAGAGAGAVADHFVGAARMIDIGKGGVRKVPDHHLRRFGCYPNDRSGRELMPYPGYADWNRMSATSDRARQACVNSGHDPADHLVGANDMVAVGKGGVRKVPDHHLRRFSC